MIAIHIPDSTGCGPAFFFFWQLKKIIHSMCIKCSVIKDKMVEFLVILNLVQQTELCQPCSPDSEPVAGSVFKSHFP